MLHCLVSISFAPLIIASCRCSCFRKEELRDSISLPPSFDLPLHPSVSPASSFICLSSVSFFLSCYLFILYFSLSFPYFFFYFCHRSLFFFVSSCRCVLLLCPCVVFPGLILSRFCLSLPLCVLSSVSSLSLFIFERSPVSSFCLFLLLYVTCASLYY